MHEDAPWQFLLLLAFLGHNLGVFVALRVYDDARKRYLRRFWAIAWAVCMYPIPVIMYVLYTMARSPVLIEDMPRLPLKTKSVIYLASYPAVIQLVFWSAVVAGFVL